MRIAQQDKVTQKLTNQKHTRKNRHFQRNWQLFSTESLERRWMRSGIVSIVCGIEKLINSIRFEIGLNDDLTLSRRE